MLPVKLRAAYFLAIAAGCFALASAEDKIEQGFRALFDGESLQGWEGKKDIFRVRDGAIVAGSLKGPVAQNEFLASEKEYGNFELRFEAKLLGEGKNAGVQFWSQRIPDNHEMKGYQADIGLMNGKNIWGALYDESRRNKMLALPEEQQPAAKVKEADWNEITIRAEDRHIQIWVNGTRTVDYTEMEKGIPAKGRFGLQIHGGAPAECCYRHIRLKELP